MSFLNCESFSEAGREKSLQPALLSVHSVLLKKPGLDSSSSIDASRFKAGLEYGLWLLKHYFDDLVILLQFKVFSERLMMLRSHDKVKSSLRNVGEAVSPLRVGLSAEGEPLGALELALTSRFAELQSQASLIDGLPGFRVFDHDTYGGPLDGFGLRCRPQASEDQQRERKAKKDFFVSTQSKH